MLIVVRDILFCGLIFSWFCAGSQSNVEPYQFPRVIPAEYKFDPLIQYEAVLNEDLGTLDLRDKEVFSEIVSFGEYHTIHSGKIYFGWKELESYLISIKNRLIPSDSIKEEIKVRIGYSSDINAYANHTGSIYLNIGILAECKNEAQIAMIMAHELSHYLHEDVKARYFNEVAIKKRGSKNEIHNLAINSAKFSRSQEFIADSVGIKLCQSAGYDISVAMSAYQLLLVQRELYQKSKFRYRRIVSLNKNNEAHQPLDVLMSSHPDISERIRKMEIQISSNRADKNDEESSVTSRLQSKSIFNKLIDQAKVETLNILYLENANRKCLEKAILFHLYDPTNRTYIYFALESLRRLTYLNENMKTQGFLTEQYSDYFNEGDGIFNNIGFLIPDSSELKNVKATHIMEVGKEELNTYEDAIHYFKNLALEQNVVEGYLTLALLYNYDAAKKELFLKKYLSFDSIRYREFAFHFRKNEIHSRLTGNKRKMVFMNELKILELRSFGYHVRHKKAYEEEGKYIASVQQFYRRYFPKKEFVALSKYRKGNYNHYYRLKSVLSAASVFSIAAERMEKQQRRNEEIKEGINDDGSETFVFGEEDEYFKSDMNNEKSKRRKKKSNVGLESENSMSKGVSDTSIKRKKDLDHNLYYYAPYCWNFTVNQGISQIEFISLFTYSNITFEHTMKKIFNSSNEVSKLFELELHRFDVQQKKSESKMISGAEAMSPNKIALRLSRFYEVDE